MFCANCGEEIDDSVAFCPYCGTKVATDGVPNVTARVAQAVGTAANRLNEATGGTGQVELKFSDFFTEVPKVHEKREIEQLFICGTEETTPSIENISTEWPKPWVWSRVLLVLLASVLGCVALFELCDNAISITGLMFLGASAVPLSMLTFFFEINIPRNISFVEIVCICFVGGICSLLAMYFGDTFNLIDKTGTGAPIPSILTAFVEETAKVLVIAFIMWQRKKNSLILKRGRNFIFNGLLVGAAVGVGFAIIETAGYALDAYNGAFGYEDPIVGMYAILFVRGLLAIGCQAAWAAAEGAALALCETEKGYSPSQLWDPRFLLVAVLCVACHALWNMYIPVLDDILVFGYTMPKYLLLIVVIWIVIAVMINQGLAQMNRIIAGEESYSLIEEEPSDSEDDNWNGRLSQEIVG